MALCVETMIVEMCMEVVCFGTSKVSGVKLPVKADMED